MVITRRLNNGDNLHYVSRLIILLPNKKKEEETKECREEFSRAVPWTWIVAALGAWKNF
jgi:hypothetical protein